MIKPFNCIFVLLISSIALHAQDEKRIGIQTNVMTLLRPVLPAFNVGVMIEDGKRQYTIETDVGLFLSTPFGPSNEELRLNGFSSQYRDGFSADITGGVHWFINDNKTIYHGLRGNIGRYSFNHQQTLCVDAESVGGVCLCNELEDNRFSTSHWRFGIHYRLGFIFPLKNENELEFSFDVGVFAFLRNNTSALGQHEICSSISSRDPQPFFPLAFDLLDNVIFDFERDAQAYLRFNLVYRFML